MANKYFEIGSQSVKISNVKHFGVSGCLELAELAAQKVKIQEEVKETSEGNVLQRLSRLASETLSLALVQMKIDHAEKQGREPAYFFITTYQGDNYKFSAPYYDPESLYARFKSLNRAGDGGCGA